MHCPQRRDPLTYSSLHLSVQLEQVVETAPWRLQSGQAAGSYRSVVSFIATMKTFPSSAGFGPPRQAPGKEHWAYLFKLLAHCCQPNFALTCENVMAPRQEEPTGQRSQPRWVALKYSSSLQSEALTPPRSEQDEEPGRGWSNPVGHSKHERLGSLF